MSTQLRLTLKLITNLLGMCRWNFRSLYSSFLTPAVRAKQRQVKVTGPRRLENGLVVPGSFLARTISRTIATKFEEEIIRLKNLCTQMDITVEKLRQDHCFCNVALLFVSEQLKEDEPRLIHTRTLIL